MRTHQVGRLGEQHLSLRRGGRRGIRLVCARHDATVSAVSAALLVLLLRIGVESRRRHLWPRHKRRGCTQVSPPRRIHSSSNNTDSSASSAGGLFSRGALGIAGFLSCGCLRWVVAQLHVQQLQVDFALDDVTLAAFPPL